MSPDALANWPTFTPRDGDMDILVKLSRAFGVDPRYVVAGGGNTSAKIDDRLYVKASGHALAHIGAEGFVAMDREKLQALAEADFGDDVQQREARFKDALLDARCDPDSTLRPSVEAVLHHLVPCAFVIHTHPVIGNALTCCNRGEELTAEWFGDDVLWTPYVDPGFTLGKKLGEDLAAYQRRTGRDCPDAILMQNHGMVVAGDTPEQVRDRTDRIIGRIATELDKVADVLPFGAMSCVDEPHARSLTGQIVPALQAILSDGESLIEAAVGTSDTAHLLACSERGRKAVELGPLSPDQIVYCGSYPAWADLRLAVTEESVYARLREAVQTYIQRHNSRPTVVVLTGIGIIALGATERIAEAGLEMYLSSVDVMIHASRLGGIHPMTDAQRDFIENWEAEAYRKKLAAGQ